MAVVIGQIVTETVLAAPGDDRAAPASASSGIAGTDAELELIVRRAAERVVEILRREWDR